MDKHKWIFTVILFSVFYKGKTQECKQDGEYLRHDHSPCLYLLCSHGVAHERSCPSGVAVGALFTRGLGNPCTEKDPQCKRDSERNSREVIMEVAEMMVPRMQHHHKQPPPELNTSPIHRKPQGPGFQPPSIDFNDEPPPNQGFRPPSSNFNEKLEPGSLKFTSLLSRPSKVVEKNDPKQAYSQEVYNDPSSGGKIPYNPQEFLQTSGYSNPFVQQQPPYSDFSAAHIMNTDPVLTKYDNANPLLNAFAVNHQVTNGGYSGGAGTKPHIDNYQDYSFANFNVPQQNQDHIQPDPYTNQHQHESTFVHESQSNNPYQNHGATQYDNNQHSQTDGYTHYNQGSQASYTHTSQNNDQPYTLFTDFQHPAHNFKQSDQTSYQNEQTVNQHHQHSDQLAQHHNKNVYNENTHNNGYRNEHGSQTNGYDQYLGGSYDNHNNQNNQHSTSRNDHLHFKPNDISHHQYHDSNPYQEVQPEYTHQTSTSHDYSQPHHQYHHAPHHNTGEGHYGNDYNNNGASTYDNDPYQSQHQDQVTIIKHVHPHSSTHTHSHHATNTNDKKQYTVKQRKALAMLLPFLLKIVQAQKGKGYGDPNIQSLETKPFIPYHPKKHAHQQKPKRKNKLNKLKNRQFALQQILLRNARKHSHPHTHVIHEVVHQVPNRGAQNKYDTYQNSVHGQSHSSTHPHRSTQGHHSHSTKPNVKLTKMQILQRIVALLLKANQGKIPIPSFQNQLRNTYYKALQEKASSTDPNQGIPNVQVPPPGLQQLLSVPNQVPPGPQISPQVPQLLPPVPQQLQPLVPQVPQIPLPRPDFNLNTHPNPSLGPPRTGLRKLPNGLRKLPNGRRKVPRGGRRKRPRGFRRSDGLMGKIGDEPSTEENYQEGLEQDDYNYDASFPRPDIYQGQGTNAPGSVRIDPKTGDIIKPKRRRKQPNTDNVASSRAQPTAIAATEKMERSILPDSIDYPTFDSFDEIYDPHLDPSFSMDYGALSDNEKEVNAGDERFSSSYQGQGQFQGETTGQGQSLGQGQNKYQGQTDDNSQIQGQGLEPRGNDRNSEERDSISIRQRLETVSPPTVPKTEEERKHLSLLKDFIGEYVPFQSTDEENGQQKNASSENVGTRNGSNEARVPFLDLIREPEETNKSELVSDEKLIYDPGLKENIKVLSKEDLVGFSSAQKVESDTTNRFGIADIDLNPESNNQIISEISQEIDKFDINSNPYDSLLGTGTPSDFSNYPFNPVELQYLNALNAQSGDIGNDNPLNSSFGNEALELFDNINTTNDIFNSLNIDEDMQDTLIYYLMMLNTLDGPAAAENGSDQKNKMAATESRGTNTGNDVFSTGSDDVDFDVQNTLSILSNLIENIDV